MANNPFNKIAFLQSLIFISLIPLIIMSTFFPKHNENKLNRILQQQFLQFSEKSVYYKTEYPKNDITGTGDKLQDIPYRALCILKNCITGCCVGDIDKIQCGTEENCNTYFGSTRRGNVAAAVIIPIAVTAIFVGFYLILRYKYFVKWDLSAVLAFTAMFVITIPLVIWYLMKYKPFGEADKKSIK